MEATASIARVLALVPLQKFPIAMEVRIAKRKQPCPLKDENPAGLFCLFLVLKFTELEYMLHHCFLVLVRLSLTRTP